MFKAHSTATDTVGATTTVLGAGLALAAVTAAAVLLATACRNASLRDDCVSTGIHSRPVCQSVKVRSFGEQSVVVALVKALQCEAVLGTGTTAGTSGGLGSCAGEERIERFFRCLALLPFLSLLLLQRQGQGRRDCPDLLGR